jgi:putative transcription antitermination factor YqgF
MTICDNLWQNKSMKYLGVDWGLKHIGLAVSEGIFASPLETIHVSSLDQAISKIKQFIKSKNIDMVVIGQAESGEAHALVQKAVRRLADENIPFIVVEETLSTYGAKEYLSEIGVGRKRRHDDNAASAAIILQRYLDENVE